MTATIITSGPGVANRILAKSAAIFADARRASTIFPKLWLPPPEIILTAIWSFICECSGQAMDGYPIGDLKTGTKISFQYVGGKWKYHGHIASEYADEEKDEDGNRCMSSRPGPCPRRKYKVGEIIASVVPAATKRSQVYVCHGDRTPAGGVILRIKGNGDTFSGPGEADYKITDCSSSRDDIKYIFCRLYRIALPPPDIMVLDEKTGADGSCC